MVMSGTGTLTNNTDEWWWRVKNPNTEWGTQQGWRNTDSRHQTAARIRNANRNRELGTVCEDIDNDLTMERRNWWVFEGAWMSCSWHCQRGSAEALISGDGSVTPTHIYTHTHHNSNTGREGSNELVNRDSTPLLRTPPGVPRFPYLSIVIIDKRVIQYVSSRYPTSLLRTVTLPVHQVLKSASPPSWVQNTIYRKCGFPVYESRRGGEPGLAD